MKALLCSECGPPEKLSVQEVPAPKAGPRQVVVDVKAAALNFPDALMVQGLYQVKPPLPFTPGAEVAGLIKEVGEGVQGLKAGDRVIGFPGTGVWNLAVGVLFALVGWWIIQRDRKGYDWGLWSAGINAVWGIYLAFTAPSILIGLVPLCVIAAVLLWNNRKAFGK